MGNRGLLHNDKQEIVRAFRLRAWITCKLEFKGRKRKVMTPNLYTELFFLDEATAFAAGHRPCAECRREDFNRFKTSWLNGNPEYGFDQKTSIQQIDNILHEERTNRQREKSMAKFDLLDIPAGTFISIDGEPYLVSNKEVFLWSPAGYRKGPGLLKTKSITILTPRSILNAFGAGYMPQTDGSTISGKQV
jgi:hypothetical protein